MKTTKSLARQEVDVYGELLQERAIISDISSEPIRDKTRYSFTVLDRKRPYVVDCLGITELALVLTNMWSCYRLAREELGFE